MRSRPASRRSAACSRSPRRVVPQARRGRRLGRGAADPRRRACNLHDRRSRARSWLRPRRRRRRLSARGAHGTRGRRGPHQDRSSPAGSPTRPRGSRAADDRRGDARRRSRGARASHVRRRARGLAAAIRQAIDAGILAFEHGYSLDDETAALMSDAGVFLTPTLCVTRLPEWMRDHALHQEQIEKAMETGPEHLESIRRAVRARHDVRDGTDYPPGEPCDGTVCAVREMEFMVDAGLSPLEALQASTINAARLCRIDGKTGAVEPGLGADLIAFDGDATADASAAARDSLRDVRRTRRAVGPLSVSGASPRPLGWPSTSAGRSSTRSSSTSGRGDDPAAQGVDDAGRACARRARRRPGASAPTSPSRDVHPRHDARPQRDPQRRGAPTSGSSPTTDSATSSRSRAATSRRRADVRLPATSGRRCSCRDGVALGVPGRHRLTAGAWSSSSTRTAVLDAARCARRGARRALDRGLLPALVRRPDARAARGSRASRARTRTSPCPSRATSPASTASTSAQAPPSSTPTSARSSSATSATLEDGARRRGLPRLVPDHALGRRRDDCRSGAQAGAAD